MSVIDILIGVVEHIPLEKAALDASGPIRRAGDAMKAHFAAHPADKQAIDKFIAMSAATLESAPGAPPAAEVRAAEPDPSLQVGGRASGANRGGLMAPGT